MTKKESKLPVEENSNKLFGVNSHLTPALFQACSTTASVKAIRIPRYISNSNDIVTWVTCMSRADSGTIVGQASFSLNVGQIFCPASRFFYHDILLPLLFNGVFFHEKWVSGKRVYSCIIHERGIGRWQRQENLDLLRIHLERRSGKPF